VLQKMGLKSLLVLMVIAVVVVPMVLIAAFAIPSFNSSLRTEAGKTLETHALVGRDRLDQLTTTHTTQMSSLALNMTVDANESDQSTLLEELDKQSKLLGFDFMFWVAPDGLVRGAGTGVIGHRLDWPLLEKMAKSAEATTFVAIVPPVELSSLGATARFDIAAKEAPGGSASPQELAGALALISVVPVEGTEGGRAGVLVGIDSLKGANDFVDALSASMGGVATIFQNGVRVATSVRNDAGERAIGTPVSDPVRQTTLDRGEPYRGSAMVVGKKHITAYDPLRDPEGKVVGMFFVGIPDRQYTNAVTRFGINFVLVLVVGLGLAIGLGFGAATTISRPIVGIRDVAVKVAEGDLKTTVPEEGFKETVQLGQAFNHMTMSLREVLSQVGASAGKLDAVSGEIASASTASAETAGSQASAVAEASASIEEITRSFGAVADGAKRVLSIAEDSLEMAEEGRTTIENTAGAVDNLADGITHVDAAAQHLAEVAETIDRVTYVIGAIAEQTKILALNAAIEAARAGEAGKGFGVVSTEIRALADSVSASVGEIASMVSGIQAASKSLTATAAEQAVLATDSVVASAEARMSFGSILEQLGKTAAAAREIAAAAAQQQAAARQIAEVMQQVSAGVSESASSSRQLAESAGDVRREAEGLHHGMGRFLT